MFVFVLFCIDVADLRFRKQIFTTVDRLMTSEPQYIIMGCSASSGAAWDSGSQYSQVQSNHVHMHWRLTLEQSRATPVLDARDHHKKDVAIMLLW